MSLREGKTACWGLLISMKDGERLSLKQISAFLEASEEVGFKAASQKELYGWTERTLCAQEYSLVVGLSMERPRFFKWVMGTGAKAVSCSVTV
jgi:hypothetical protein